MKELNNFYFTFGSDEQYPFQNTYLVIRSTSEQSARALFPKIYPNRDNSETLNFAFSYNEAEWNGTDGREPVSNFYTGIEPATIIIDLSDDDYAIMPVESLKKLKLDDILTDEDHMNIIKYIEALNPAYMPDII